MLIRISIRLIIIPHNFEQRPCYNQAQNHGKQRSKHNTTRRKELNANILASASQDRTRDWRTYERSDALEDSHHAQPRPQATHIRGDGGQDHRPEGHHAAGPEAVQDGKSKISGFVCHADPVKDAGAAQGAHDNVRVQGADHIGNEGGYDPARDGRGVENGQ